MSIVEFAHYLALSFSLAAAVPVADPSIHVEHALAAAREDLPVEIVLSIAWYESGLTAAPPDQEPHHCGVLQVAPRWTGIPCVELRDLAHGYAAGANVLRVWLRHSRGAVLPAVRAYRCGWAGLVRACAEDPAYGTRVLALATRLGWRP